MSVLNQAGLDQDFSLEKAEVSKQKVSEENATASLSLAQMTMDSFIEVRSSQSSGTSKTDAPNEWTDTPDVSTFTLPALNESTVVLNETTAAQPTPENFEHMLDLDDLDFDEIDLDSIMWYDAANCVLNI